MYVDITRERARDVSRSIANHLDADLAIHTAKALEYFQKAIEITPELAHGLIRVRDRWISRASRSISRTLDPDACARPMCVCDCDLAHQRR
mgnify:CR=1 FL=1